MANDKPVSMGLGMMASTLAIVGFIFAGPGWFMWSSGPKIIGGIFLAITGIVVLVTIGTVRPLWHAFVAYVCGLITTGISIAILAAIFGRPW